MMAKSTKFAPPNSLVLIVDQGGGTIPATMTEGLIASTNSCIAVGCRSEIDGDTEFILGEVADVNPGSQPAFRGNLKTPSRKIALRAVTGVTIFEISVPHQDTTVCVWANDAIEPDQVIVGIE